MEHLNLLILIGVIYLWYREHGLQAASVGVAGLVFLISFGRQLPWYAIMAMAFWLGYIVRHWNHNPEPEILDRNES